MVFKYITYNGVKSIGKFMPVKVHILSTLWSVRWNFVIGTYLAGKVNTGGFYVLCRRL